MIKARGQSLQRAVRRGNACFFYNTITKTIDVCYRKGIMPKVFKHNYLNRINVDEV